MAEKVQESNGVKASFDLSTPAGQIKVFNAQSGASLSLKKVPESFIIEAEGIMQYNEVVDSYGKPQECTITVIFGEDGTSYAGVSDTVAAAGSKLIDLVKNLKLETFKVQVIKQTSEKGNEFLNIRL